MCAHKFYRSNNFKRANFEYKGVLHCEGHDCEKFFDDIMETPLSDSFVSRRMQMLSRPDGLMLYGKLEVAFSCTSDLLYSDLKVGMRLVRFTRNFYMSSDNSNIGPGIVDCSLYTHRVALKDDYHKKRIDMLA